MIASREGGYFQRWQRMGIGYHYLGGLMPKDADNCLRSISMERGIFLRIIDGERGLQE